MLFPLRIHREARLLSQMFPGAMPGGPEYANMGPALSLNAYNAMPYGQQMGYMQDTQWMNQAMHWQMYMHMQSMPAMPWYQNGQGGMPFDAMTQGHYMPYGYMHHGAGWQAFHPAWGGMMPPFTPPNPWQQPPATPYAPRVPHGPYPHGPRTPPGTPPSYTPPPRTPPPGVPERPPTVPPLRAPTHPLDVGGRLSLAYSPFFLHADPAVRAAAARWWGKAIRILEAHPHDTVLFNQLVRGATDNLQRGTTQFLSVRDSRQFWEQRQPRPQVLTIPVHAAERDAGAITISRAGSTERILYYPHKSAPFWDMRGMDIAREWGVVPVSSTYETGEYPRTIEVRFYGPGEYSIAGVGGITPPQTRVSMPELPPIAR